VSGSIVPDATGVDLDNWEIQLWRDEVVVIEQEASPREALMALLVDVMMEDEAALLHSQAGAESMGL
jgi:hypothetical protein